MPDRHAVMTEILRVLRPGGIVGIAVWSEGTPPEPFDSYARILRAHKIPEPYLSAYDTSAVATSEREIEFLLRSAGPGANCPHRRTAARMARPLKRLHSGITGSTYGPGVASLSRAEQEEVFASIVKEASGEMPPAVMRAVLGRGVAGEALRGGT